MSRAVRWLPLCLLSLSLAFPTAAIAQTCTRTITADVVAIDQVWFWNRLGAVQPQGMMFSLRRMVGPVSGTTLTPGNARLRFEWTRPRPMVLRMNVGDCLQIDFENLLSPNKKDQEQPATRQASIHVVGLELVGSTLDDGSFVGQNPNGLVAPGQSATYTYSAEREGQHLLYSQGTTTGGEGDGGQINSGLFGAVIVEPAGSSWYRGQTSEYSLRTAKGSSTSYSAPIDWEARLPASHPEGPVKILNILDGNEIVHTPLSAIIVGSPPGTGGAQAGWFPTGAFPANATYPERRQPFREFVTIYHDEIGAVQAFPEFEQPVLGHTLHSGRDAFAINYGTAGMGAEVFANRLGVGPMRDCAECKFEEFFLSSWTVGDPAMVVDVPANFPCMESTNDPLKIGSDPDFPQKVQNLRDGTPCTPTAGRKATKAFFFPDPSNVFHSYLGDHVRFRVLHAGSKEHHIHHLHAHQWLFSADSDKSTYLDSQALGPGGSFTAEIAYHGGGNLNQTPGDSIFHCHFYPHFAQGMWALWRVHDVYERGTTLDSADRPATGSRALPDGEIAAGTPIPAIIPLPGKPMPPQPGAAVSIVDGQVQISGTGNPGFPFFVPARAGHRPPKPPLDTIDDGGLPRHRINSGTFVEAHTRLDWHKELLKAVAEQLPEAGTAVEQAAMTFHAQSEHGTCRTDGACDGTGGSIKFRTNGRPAVAGAPLADPCTDGDGNAVGTPRLYKAADIEDDVKINKKGWHFPQQRFTALWEDVDDFLGLGGGAKKPPEPLFFRANSRDCINYHFTNLVPKEYKQDDFQVRTPTDVLGQHIHLVKFDVLASDGAANGFNYEDGSFSPGEVRERIAAIRSQNSCTTSDSRNGTFACPTAKTHPFFGAGPDKDGDGKGDWLGAQTTVQRWYADPILDNQGNDRTLRTVFTHDHFGPSTHQQVGLYAGLVIEPQGSTWKHNETGDPFYTRPDGGPTSWQAVITAPNEPDYREFLLAFGDFQLAYEAEATTFPNRARAINPPAREEVPLSVSNDLLRKRAQCPGNVAPPCPELVSADDVGTMTVNYRQEPLALRLRDPSTNQQASIPHGAGDPALAFSSFTARTDAAFNAQPTFYPNLTSGLLSRDPFTPLLRAYENDRVQIRILVGAHEEGHNFSVDGIKWLAEPSEPNSGYRGSQMMGISEHFEFIVPQLIKNPSGAYVDRLWSAGSSTDDYWNGIWGLLRAYTGLRPDLEPLPENPNGRSNIDPSAVGAFDFSCPKNAPVRTFEVMAVSAGRALPGGRLVYNSRTDGSFGALFDPTAILFFRTSDLENTSGPYKVKAGVPIEPLILRARAGECIKLTLINQILNPAADLDGYNTLPMIVEGFNANDIKPGYRMGLRPQMLFYDVSRFEGTAIGGNTSQLLSPGSNSVTYEWYAGDVTINADGTITATPIEFGAINLISADPLEHASKGAIGALIIEPSDATWVEDSTSRAAATVTSASAGGSFREFVVLFQNNLNLRMDDGTANGQPVKNLAGMEDPEDSGQKAINYRTEPLWKRMQHAPETPLEQTRDFSDWWDVLANSKVGSDPQTPIFRAEAGQQVRFRILQPTGHSRNIVFALHGHVWDKQPWINNSTRIGRNSFSFWEGAHTGTGPTDHFNALLRHGAGGKFSIVGDYLFRDQTSTGLDGGMWGILRVE
jgi:hypothetical protein